MLGIIRRANINVIVFRLALGAEKRPGEFVQLVFVRVDRIDIAQRAKESALQLPLHLAFVLHRGSDPVDGNLRICRLAEISALITRQRAITENVGPRDIAG